MRPGARSIAVGIALALVAPGWAAPESSTTTQPPAKATVQVIRYRDDRLTVDLHGAPLRDVLQEVAKQSGAALMGEPREARELTLSFEDVAIKEAIERLLGDQNFTLKYDDAGKLKTIELRGGQDAKAAPVETDKGVSGGGKGTPPKWYAFYKVFNRSDMIPISGDLAKKLGKDEVGWDYLGNTALGYPDAKVRREATHVLVRALDQDPELRQATLDALNAMSDAELAEFARAVGYHMADDFVRNILQEVSDSALRSRARGVLHELRKNPYLGPRPEPK